jgi:hypothetical protein
MPTIFVQPRKPQMAMWHIFNACRITKVRDTQSGHVILIAFPRGNISYTNAPQCYVIRTLTVLLQLVFRFSYQILTISLGDSLKIFLRSNMNSTVHRLFSLLCDTSRPPLNTFGDNPYPSLNPLLMIISIGNWP